MKQNLIFINIAGKTTVNEKFVILKTSFILKTLQNLI